MTKTGEHTVFLSYAKEDLDEVRKVYEGLGKRGLSVWFDKADLGPGNWKPQVEKAISRSLFFVICISEAALRKTGDDTPGFQDEELNRAYNIAQTVSVKEFAIVPVRLEDCGRGDTRLSSFQQYDLFNDFEKELDKLAVHLGGRSLSDAGAVEERSEDEKMLDLLMGKAEVAYYAGEYKKVITFCDIAIDEKPDHHWAWNNKAAALGKLGQHGEAIAAFDKAVGFKPDYHEAWNNKGISLDKLGRHKEAKEAFDRAEELKLESGN